MDKEKWIYFTSFLVSKIINRFKRANQFNFQNILIIRLDEIGDMITTLPVFELLKQKYPQSKITLWCKPFIQNLVQENPNIDLIVKDKKSLEKKYDLILDLRGNKQTILYALFHPPKIRLDRGTVRFRNKFKEKKHPHEVFTNLQVLKPLLEKLPEKPEIKLHISEKNQQNTLLFLQRNVIEDFVVFHTGARKKLRRWHPLKFAKLAEILQQKYAWNIVFVGDKNDQANIQKIQKNIDFETFSHIGQGSLMDYAALVSKAKLMIGNESGPMHIAAATATPTIGLFGPGEPHIFAPFGDKTTFIHHKLHCNPCDQINCIYPQNPCINHIEVEEVLEAIENLLRKE